MKKGVLVLAWALTIALVMGLTGCGMLGKKAMEGAIEDALGGNIDISDDGATISTDEGMISSGDDMEWPAEAMGNLPVPSGKITFVMKGADNTYCAVEISDWDRDDAVAYRDTLLDMGYTDGLQAVDEEGITFNCIGGDGSSVMFTYSFSSNSGSVTYSVAPDESSADTAADDSADNGSDDSAVSDAGDDAETGEEEEEEEEEIDMTDVSPWPADFMGDIPEINGKIVSLQSYSTYEKNVQVDYVLVDDARGFISALIDLGYDVDPCSSEAEGYLDYSAMNENGDTVYFSWSEGYATFNLMKAE